MDGDPESVDDTPTGENSHKYLAKVPCAPGREGIEISHAIPSGRADQLEEKVRTTGQLVAVAVMSHWDREVERIDRRNHPPIT